jgi:hypothetical protein
MNEDADLLTCEQCGDEFTDGVDGTVTDGIYLCKECEMHLHNEAAFDRWQRDGGHSRMSMGLTI